MKIEEWEDGQVNIGITVCPTKPTAIAAALQGTKDGSILMSNAPGNFVVVPKSAFIIRPPQQYQSQGGVKVAYAHQGGPSSFIIMLNPQDQGYQSTISDTQHQDYQQTPSIVVSEIMNFGNEREAVEVDERNNIKKLDRNLDHNDTNQVLQETLGESSEESEILTIPQLVEGEAVTPSDREATGTPQKESSTRSVDMKRVSWVEDCENFNDKKDSGSGSSCKEGKSRESVRKPNGLCNNSGSRNVPGKKQHGFSTGNGGGSIAEGCTKGSKRSGEKSRIPHIAASAGEYPPSCEFYRRQMLRECMYNPSNNMAENWYDYTSLQKYAGQKVFTFLFCQAIKKPAYFKNS